MEDKKIEQVEISGYGSCSGVVAYAVTIRNLNTLEMIDEHGGYR
jgi:hypothetical protein